MELGLPARTVCPTETNAPFTLRLVLLPQALDDFVAYILVGESCFSFLVQIGLANINLQAYSTAGEVSQQGAFPYDNVTPCTAQRFGRIQFLKVCSYQIDSRVLKGLDIVPSRLPYSIGLHPGPRRARICFGKKGYAASGPARRHAYRVVRISMPCVSQHPGHPGRRRRGGYRWCRRGSSNNRKHGPCHIPVHPKFYGVRSPCLNWDPEVEVQFAVPVGGRCRERRYVPVADGRLIH